jgi:hypothetical protein
VDGEVGPVLEQGDFKFLGEESLGQFLTFIRKGRGLQFIASGLDNFDVESQTRKRGAAFGEDLVGLREREGAAAGGDQDGAFLRHESN